MKRTVLLSLLSSAILMTACNSEEYLIAPERQHWGMEIDMCGKILCLFGNVEEVTVVRDGDIIYSYVFDNKGNVTHNTIYECDGDTPQTYIYHYNENGLTESTQITRDGKTFNVGKYKYDSNNNLIEETITDGLREKDTYVYDENCRKVESMHYTGWKQESKTTFRYDQAGNLIEETITDPKGKEIWVQTAYEYDSNGNVCKKTFADCSYQYLYDQHGNITEEQLYKTDGTLCSKDVYKYDSKGNVTEKSTYKADGTLSYKYTYELEYDSQNNVTKAKAEYSSDNNNAVTNYELKIKYRQ